MADLRPSSAGSESVRPAAAADTGPSRARGGDTGAPVALESLDALGLRRWLAGLPLRDGGTVIARFGQLGIDGGFLALLTAEDLAVMGVAADDAAAVLHARDAAVLTFLRAQHGDGT